MSHDVVSIITSAQGAHAPRSGKSKTPGTGNLPQARIKARSAHGKQHATLHPPILSQLPVDSRQHFKSAYGTIDQIGVAALSAQGFHKHVQAAYGSRVQSGNRLLDGETVMKAAL